MGKIIEKINFEGATSCNARCIFCPRYEMTRPMGEMSDELFHKIIKDGKEMKVYRYSPFMNGEPFVFKRIWKWLDYMEKEKVAVCLFTNGEYLDVEKINKYKNIYLFNISLNAATEETYNKVMRGPNYKTVMKNLEEMFKKSKVPFRVSFVKVEENQHEIEEFAKKYPKHRFCGFANWTGDKKNSLARKGKKKPCYPLFHQMYVLWDGRVVPCCMDYNAKMVLGDANKQTLKEIWDSYKWMRDKHANYDFDIPVCKDCNYNVDG